VVVVLVALGAALPAAVVVHPVARKSAVRLVETAVVSPVAVLR
jgi:hypothetical protein